MLKIEKRRILCVILTVLMVFSTLSMLGFDRQPTDPAPDVGGNPEIVLNPGIILDPEIPIDGGGQRPGRPPIDGIFPPYPPDDGIIIGEPGDDFDTLNARAWVSITSPTVGTTTTNATITVVAGANTNNVAHRVRIRVNGVVVLTATRPNNLVQLSVSASLNVGANTINVASYNASDVRMESYNRTVTRVAGALVPVTFWPGTGDAPTIQYRTAGQPLGWFPPDPVLAGHRFLGWVHLYGPNQSQLVTTATIVPHNDSLRVVGIWERVAPVAPRIELWLTGISLTQGQELWVDAMATQGDSLRFSLYNNGNRVFFHTLGHRDTVSNTVIIPMNHLGTNRLVVQSFWASTGVVTATEVRYVTVIAGVGSLPGIPVQLAPTRTGNSITVHWNAPTSGSSPTGYNIFLGSAQSGFMGHFSVPSNARRFTIPAGWIEGSCYWFYVEATNDRGVSGFSDRRYSTPHAPISIRNNVFDFPTALVSPVTFFEPSAEAQNAVRMEIRLNGRVIARSNTDHISFHGVVPADLRNLGYHELQFRAYCRNGISTAITRRILVTPPVNQRVQIGLWYVPQRPAPKNVVPLNVRHIPCVNLPTSQWAAWGLSVGRGISWWNNSASNVSFQTVGATATANTLTVSYSSSSVIGELHNYWGNHLHGRTHHPRTTILINTRTIFRVSIRYGWTPTQLQNFVANVVAHELGHAVGLEDNPRRDNGTSIHSVMTQCAHTLVTMSGPTTNDIAYVNRAYPRVP